jgi:hypothetical protein
VDSDLGPTTRAPKELNLDLDCETSSLKVEQIAQREVCKC